ncbi:MAG: hypothetical protein ACTHK4_10805, partial [Mycobacteriales bacterium]
AGVGVVVADNTGGGGHHKVGVATQPSGQQQVIADPWWDTWTTDRYNGGVSQAFLSNARPTYNVADGPVKITVYAAGTTADGTQWVMFTDSHDGHVMEWLQGRDDQPDYGESSGTVTPDITWTSWSIPTRASQAGAADIQQWLIVVGKPGTTAIDYSSDGTNWEPMRLEHGIAVMKITTATGFPPATAKVRLSDASGVYATGSPAGAGANAPSDSPSPGPGDATPTATASPSVGPVTTTVQASPAN